MEIAVFTLHACHNFLPFPGKNTCGNQGFLVFVHTYLHTEDTNICLYYSSVAQSEIHASKIRSDCRLYSNIQQVLQVQLVALSDSARLKLSRYDKYWSTTKNYLHQMVTLSVIAFFFFFGCIPFLSWFHPKRFISFVCLSINNSWRCTSWYWNNASICVKNQNKKAWERS